MPSLNRRPPTTLRPRRLITTQMHRLQQPTIRTTSRNRNNMIRTRAHRMRGLQSLINRQITPRAHQALASEHPSPISPIHPIRRTRQHNHPANMRKRPPESGRETSSRRVYHTFGQRRSTPCQHLALGPQLHLLQPVTPPTITNPTTVNETSLAPLPHRIRTHPRANTGYTHR